MLLVAETAENRRKSIRSTGKDEHEQTRFAWEGGKPATLGLIGIALSSRPTSSVPILSIENVCKLAAALPSLRAFTITHRVAWPCSLIPKVILL